MLEINNRFWVLVIKGLKPYFSDNAGVILILAGLSAGAFFGAATYLIFKGRIKYFGLMAVWPLISACYMLRQLPVIHPRIHTMLKTVSCIVLSSGRYTEAFSHKAGFVPAKESDIVYHLYYLTPAGLEGWENTDPQMLYRKLYSAFHKSRYFFGYVDRKPQHIFYVILAFLLIAAVLTQAARERTGSMALLAILQTAMVLITWNLKAGCILILFSMAFSECTVSSFLAMLCRQVRIYRQEKKTASHKEAE